MLVSTSAIALCGIAQDETAQADRCIPSAFLTKPTPDTGSRIQEFDLGLFSKVEIARCTNVAKLLAKGKGKLVGSGSRQ